MKRFFVIVLTAVMFSLSFSPLTFADGISSTSVLADSKEVITNLELDCESAILYEANTGTVIYSKDSSKALPISHLTKLMTILLAYEKMESDKNFTFDTLLTTSQNANSKGGSQIWLNASEKISVKELFMSTIIGNASDAACVLAEGVSGSEPAFVELMNKKAKSLGLKNTKYYDSTGISDKNVSTAEDIAILSREVLKCKDISSLFTEWMVTVRGGAAELVSLNTLINTYKGVTGLKACASEKAGNCIVASAKKNNMNLISVSLNGKSEDNRAKNAKILLDYGFQYYSLISPKIDKDALRPIKVSHGEQLESFVKAKRSTKLVIKKAYINQISTEFKREESLEAPLYSGQKVGEIIYKKDDSEIMKVDIVASQDNPKLTIKSAFVSLLMNMLKN